MLIVDDEASVRSVAKAMLERFGFATLTACDGGEALALFRERPDEIDLVLLDLTMPVMDGPETLRALRAVRPNVRVLLSSGHSEGDARTRLAGDPLHFIQKPYRPADLVERVRETLAA